MSLTDVLARIDADLPAATDRLLDLLRIPSISTDPAYKAECQRAADWLVADLASMGISASARPTPGHPMVVGHFGGLDTEVAPEREVFYDPPWAGPATSSKPHILFYGHYDVQPVDPLSLWHSDPFDPKVEDTAKGRVIRGRGAADDKGQLMTFVEACRAWQAVTGHLPCRITFLFEGEEESGSPSLIPFLEANADELRADVALICDTGMFQDTSPAIITMLRGMAREEFTIHAATRDLHSGMYGGPAINPIRVLTRILGGLHDDQGRVVVPGFYDGVPELPDAIRAQWQNLAFDHGTFLGDVGLSHPAGESDRTPLEMIWSRPTAEINGIWGGYTGEGFKTVLPAEAHAKISFRLVGQQDPAAISRNFRDWLAAQLPADCTVEWQELGGAAASQMQIDHPLFEKTRHALTEEWGTPASYVGCGGSIPIAGYFQSILGMESILAGFGRDDDQIHSPNEKYDMECFHKGIRSWARVLDKIA